MNQQLQKQEEKFQQMTEEPVGKLIRHLAVPCIISMMITAFYNLADTFFVGQMHSNTATGAVGVAFSLMAIIQAIGFFLDMEAGISYPGNWGGRTGKLRKRWPQTVFSWP